MKYEVSLEAYQGPLDLLLELIEKNGDKTVIELKNIKTNVAIAPNIFSVN